MVKDILSQRMNEKYHLHVVDIVSIIIDADHGDIGVDAATSVDRMDWRECVGRARCGC